jgi:thiol-disulfide isomerase/thioredoxin
MGLMAILFNGLIVKLLVVPNECSICNFQFVYMKYLLLILTSFLLCKTTICFSQNTHVNKENGNQILKKVSQKLNSLRNIRYEYKREVNYFSEHYYNKLDGDIYLGFDDQDTILGFRYQMENKDSKEIFNGTEEFTLDKQNKSIEINDQPKQSSFDHLSLFYNSLITLKNALPIIISDSTLPKTARDTTINKVSYYMVKITFDNKNVINPYLGKTRSPFTLKKNVIYKIIIDKESYLPTEVIQVNNLNNDYIQTSFTNIITNPVAPNNLSWYYSTYTDEYKPAKPPIFKLITVESSAPDWTLPLYNTNKDVSLKDFKGKVILLDFWIKNCGPCITSVPNLNALQKKYGKRSFDILGINSYDSEENIKWFCEQNKPEYKILINGKKVAQDYGVFAFPTTVLIDKNGRVVYAGGFDQSILETLIKKML